MTTVTRRRDRAVARGRATRHLDDLDDDALVRICQRFPGKSAPAFEVLVRRYEGLAHRVALRYLGRPSDAEDATQEAFLKAFRGLARFRRHASFKTWLFRILHNQCLTVIVARGRRDASEIDGLDPAFLDGTSENEDEQARFIANEAIQNTLNRLSEPERQSLVLRHIAGLSLQEIATTLGISLSAAKMRLYRAQERFIAAYEQGTTPPPDTSTDQPGYSR